MTPQSKLYQPLKKVEPPKTLLSTWSNPVAILGLVLFLGYELAGISAFWAEDFGDFITFKLLLPLPLLILTAGLLGIFFNERVRVGYGRRGATGISMFGAGFVLVALGNTIEFTQTDSTSFENYTTGGGFIVFAIGAWGMFLGSFALLFATITGSGEPRRESTLWIVLALAVVTVVMVPAPTVLDLEPSDSTGGDIPTSVRDPRLRGRGLDVTSTPSSLPTMVIPQSDR